MHLIFHHLAGLIYNIIVITETQAQADADAEVQ